MKNKLKIFGIGGPALLLAVGLLACSATPAAAPSLPHVTANAWYVNVPTANGNEQFISFYPKSNVQVICTYRSGYYVLSCTGY